MPIRILNNNKDLEQDIHALITLEPQFHHAFQSTGKIELRRRRDGYASLVRIIIGQQVSVASAEAIWARLQEAGFAELDAIDQADIEQLKSCGLSNQKANYLKNLAAAKINFDELSDQPDQEVHNTLTKVKGIGPWSAEIYLMFSLGRADVIAPADLALQEAAKILFKLPARPNAREFAQLAEAWSPYRNAAAQLLWAYYHVNKNRAGIGF